MKKGIVIGCVDPRLHTVLPEAAELMGVERTYQFRVPGPDGVMRQALLHTEEAGLVAGVRRLLSLTDIESLAFIGHTDCAGHQVSDDEHREHIALGAQALKAELKTDKPVLAMIAVRGDSDSDWTLEELGTY